jgi:ubiquinone/menaquinone biosynthesis C-methylase UbiE
MLRVLTDLPSFLPLRLQGVVRRRWYEYLSRMDKEANMLFMNYGWADLDSEAARLPLSDEDEQNRYCIQLYHHVAGAVNLRGLDVLEVGSGRGGGSSYIMRYLRPRSVVGVDLAKAAVRFCNRHYRIPRLSFVRGDAESLQFDDSSFHAVVNIESSHCYRSMEQFLNGVCRVLKPNGYFLFADYRGKEELDTLRNQLRQAGLTLLKEQVITPNVLRALDLDCSRKGRLIKEHVPKILHGAFNEFAGMRGTRSAYNRFNTGDKEYLSFVLQR